MSWGITALKSGADVRNLSGEYVGVSVALYLRHITDLNPGEIFLVDIEPLLLTPIAYQKW